MIEVQLRKRLGDFQLDVSFRAGDETVVLFGHSGSGKSLTLVAVAGLMAPDEGRVVIDGQMVFDSENGISLPPQSRMVGYVPQQLALFPHLSAAHNIGYGLGHHPRVARERRVAELAEMLGLEGLLDRPPHKLSGGQQQRVALARALAPNPSLLLLDEPFSALDASIRRTLRRELIALRERLDLTILFVTHDLSEAYNLADRLVVYDEGSTIDEGPRRRVYAAPTSRRVAQLLEFTNIFSGVAEPGEGGGTIVAAQGLSLKTLATGLQPGQPVDVCIRPDYVLLVRSDRGAGPQNTHVRGRIVDESAHGSSYTLRFAIEGTDMQIEAELPVRPYEVLDVANQKEWWLGLRREDLHVMPAPGDRQAAPGG